MDQTILHQAVRRIIVAPRSGRTVNLVKFLGLVIVEQRTARGLWVADKTNSARAHLRDLCSANGEATVVIVDEDGVAADLINEAVFERAILRAVEEDRAAAINRPIRT